MHLRPACQAQRFCDSEENMTNQDGVSALVGELRRIAQNMRPPFMDDDRHITIDRAADALERLYKTVVGDATEILADGLHSNGHFVLADHVRRSFNTMIPSIDALAAMERYRAADALSRSPSVRVDDAMSAIRDLLRTNERWGLTPQRSKAAHSARKLLAKYEAALTKATP
jgi:hypothetical protein